MKKSKLIALFIIFAMIISNCFALLSSTVYADGERTIYFNTGDYNNDTKTVIFHVGGGEGAVDVPVKIEGTTANLVQHEGGCKLVYTESLGNQLRLKVIGGYIAESMEIRAMENEFHQELQVDQDNYVILSDPGNQWVLPNDFYFEIIHAGQGGGQQGQGTAIHFDTDTYTDTTATFSILETNVTVTVSGTVSTINQDGDHCGIGFTEELGNQVTLRVSENFNSETMEIGAAGNDGFYHELPIDQNRYVIFSGVEMDEETHQERNWSVPSDFHLGIVERGANPGPQPGNDGVRIQFDTTTVTATTATFDVAGVEVTLTVSGEGLQIQPDTNNSMLEIPESQKNTFKLQVSENYDPETMEIYAADAGSNGFTEILQVDENRYVVFTQSVIERGGFHFGVTGKGNSPVNMITITLDPNGGKTLEGFREVINDVPTGEEFIFDEQDLFIEAPACYEFDGWKVGKVFYGSGEPVVFTENTTVVAQWRKIPHEPEEIVSTKVTKATLTKNGEINKSIRVICSECGEELGGRGDKQIIPYPKTISLSKTSFTYNKNVQKPIVKVIGSDGKAIATSNYTVKYSNKDSKKAGRYSVTITFKGDYYTGTKTLTYDIKPKGTSLSKVTAGKKQFTAKWKAQKTETTGYEIQYATNKSFTSGKKTVNVKKNKTTSTTVKKLKAKKKYYVRIRTYKTVNGKKFYSGWSKVLNVTTKK